MFGRAAPAFLACALLLRAQDLLTGRVVDETGTPVGQARVSVRARDGGAPVAVTSGATGAFSASLADQGDYLVSVQREGFYELRDRPVRVAAASEVTLQLTPIREVFQSVDVQATPSPIDLDQTGRESSLSGTQINDIPFQGSHSLRSAMKIMPGVVQDRTGALHFEGASENQVLYLLNGFNIGNPLTGRFDTRMAVEGIRSLDFASGRFSPEFGKGSAGVLEVRTDNGTDALHYTATNFIPGVDMHEGLRLGNWNPRFGVSGPVLRGRMWFADNFDTEYQQAVVDGLPAGQNVRQGLAGANLLHTQTNLSPTHILFADFLVNSNFADRSGLSPLDPVSTTTRQRGHQYFASFKDQLYFGRGLMLELGYAHNSVLTRQIPEGDAPYVISPEGRSGNYFVNSTEEATRDQFLAGMIFPAFRFLGSHQIKAGADLDRLGYEADFRRTAFEQIGLEGQALSRTTFLGSGIFRRPNAEASSYFVDTWRVRPNVQVSLGLRQDWDELIRRRTFSPRVSLVYSPFRSGKTRLAAGYAITYDATSLSLFSQPLDQQAMTEYYNPDGTLSAIPFITRFIIDSRRFAAPRSVNWTASFDRELPYRIYLSANYLRRSSGDGLAYAGAFDGALRLTNLRREKYHSASIILRQNFASQYQWSVSYTRSSTLSNAVVDLRVDQTTQVLDNLGPLGWDAPNRFLASAYLPIPRTRKWAVATLVDARSGFPFSVTDQLGLIAGPVNANRYPSNFDWNLHIERVFTLAGYRFALRGGFNNLTDHPNPTAVNNIIGAPDFLRFYGLEGRHFVMRIRFFGRSKST